MTPLLQRRAKWTFAVIAVVVLVACPVSLYVYPRPELILISGDLVTSKRYPPRVLAAVLLAEDPVFLKRSRIDTVVSTAAILKSAFFELFGRRVVVDAPPSLVQQMVGWHIRRPARPLTYNFKRIALAAVIDATESKEDVLNAYVDHFYLGRRGDRQIYGLGEAAQVYFGVAPGQLTLLQTIALAAALRAPNVLSPRKVSGTAISRRLLLLQELQHSRTITDEECEAAREVLLRGDA